ncbi:hypothetical protein QN277_016545 [Acacia crassicarpa]|uniref:Transmembrane protein n=1 Tax=Acacia crassicarpa TaxID=499986 RepID=A0AAE1MWV8_9FABA|nr:hypothetical protein QN277_016545 [Acacia crassicarpa]
MDGMQLALPIVGIVAAAAVTFYAVSFAEIREKSFRELDDSEYEDGNGGFKPSPSSRERRARRKASKGTDS